MVRLWTRGFVAIDTITFRKWFYCLGLSHRRRKSTRSFYQTLPTYLVHLCLGCIMGPNQNPERTTHTFSDGDAIIGHKDRRMWGCTFHIGVHSMSPECDLPTDSRCRR
jgi:hypothetical protein